MDWTVRGSNPGGVRLPSSVQTGPGAHPSSQTLGTASLQDINLPRRGVTHPHPSRTEVKERVELHLHTLLSAFMAVYMVKFT
jgi:hypothetical protein